MKLPLMPMVNLSGTNKLFVLLTMDYVDQFPILGNYTYLNTANSGILSKSLANWRFAHDQDFLANGSLFRSKKDEFLQNGRKSIANFFNANVDRTYLVPNFSHGFNSLLAGLAGRKRFLLLKEDYPSVNYPVESLGHSCTYVTPDENLEQNISEAIERFDPEVLALSLVQYTNGIKIDLNFLKQLKAHHPQLLIVADGTQFCGMAGFDFEGSGIDVLIASGYKWLLGGYGNGFVLITEYAVSQLYQREKGFALPAESFLKDSDTLSLYFEPGHLDTLNFGTLFNAIQFLEQQDMQGLGDKIARLALHARQAFTARQLLSPAVTRRKEHSAIFNLILPEAKIEELQQNDIIFSSRGAGIRASFHFYNSENDLEKLLDIIDR
jgi:selenocysteine lyase/cysteine desulfurase